MEPTILVIKFVVGFLAVWRLSSLFSRESGPWGIFNKIRIGLYVASMKFKFLQTFTDGIACIWCNSVWFSAIVSIWLSCDIIEWMIYTLALSACAIQLEERYGNSQNKNTSEPG